MRVLNHFLVEGFSNAYLVGPDGPGDAILVDPGAFDATLLGLIEAHGYYARALLLTGTGFHHAGGIKTIRRVYDSRIYAAIETIEGYDAELVTEEGAFTAAGFQVEVFPVADHLLDALIYRIGNVLFTGDVLSAGRRAQLGNDYSKELIAMSVSESLAHLADDTIVLPAHGPPTTLGAERTYNQTFTAEGGSFPET
jgi:glyoxylase-like metal-dependent hydrolase (beta-lactamase superfamily II)